MLETLPRLEQTTFPPLRRDAISTLQMNLGYRCNQQCLHCHVNAGPKRKELMAKETMNQALAFIHMAHVETLDLTGGAPEMNPHFRYLVQAARNAGVKVIDRCNLTILSEPGQETLAAFLAQNGVEITASLPCYEKENVDGQRGKGVFEASIQGLQTLNALGYGREGSGLTLNLVYNPTGPFLPPSQQALEKDYKEQLAKRYGISFNHLLTLANMPIQRFGSSLISKGQFDEYMRLLCDSHSEANLETVMCRSMVSVDWEGYLYDCDFNQMLKLPIVQKGNKLHISQLKAEDLIGKPITVSGHCYGCTAGQGSSCGGALS
jgi:radical SAM/Cys-rich protein